MADTKNPEQEPWFLRYGFSVRFPSHRALSASDAEFLTFVRDDLRGLGGEFEMMDIAKEDPSPAAAADGKEAKISQPFMDALVERVPRIKKPNIVLTENADVAFESTNNPLVDLFAELEDVASGPRLMELLDAAWAHDPLSTLKIIFNCRSIHLGKGSKPAFYRAAGWLARHHPLTLLVNLTWLCRPVIEKTTPKKTKDGEGDDDMVIVGAEESSSAEDNSENPDDVTNGMAHGYWKDLLNLLALSVNDKLDVLASPRDILNVTQINESKSVDKDTARTKRHNMRDERQRTAIGKFNKNKFYRALHMTVARLFAAQLKQDLKALNSDDAEAKRKISLCAKWAPSHDRFHDRHTFIVSSIAELVHPMPKLQALIEDEPSAGEEDKKREMYLRHVREEYRKSISALRKHLDIVERNMSAKTYSKIKYDRVPSTAMKRNVKTFIARDKDRFTKYTEDVAAGKANISGATLLPSTLIQAVKTSHQKRNNPHIDVENIVYGGQWKTMVQRIRDAGTLESSIAVCDVSGSMEFYPFPDGTVPIDSSIGLSLLVAEVGKPPFGGSFISFSAEPRVCKVDLSKPLHEKYDEVLKGAMGYNTNFVAVFEKLILPMAKEHKLKQEDMVKRVFVFSDMQFDEADHANDKWTTSYERIAAKYQEAGYEMPELIFWNLAGGHGGGAAPKPITSDIKGTSMVSGYSQGMLKVFLENGSFEAPEEEVVEEVEELGEDGEVVKVSKKRKVIDPLGLVQKAIGHKAYSMLEVVD